MIEAAEEKALASERHAIISMSADVYVSGCSIVNWGNCEIFRDTLRSGSVVDDEVFHPAVTLIHRGSINYKERIGIISLTELEVSKKKAEIEIEIEISYSSLSERIQQNYFQEKLQLINETAANLDKATFERIRIIFREIEIGIEISCSSRLNEFKNYYKIIAIFQEKLINETATNLDKATFSNIIKRNTINISLKK